ncbi:DUF7159 family protein [Mycobacterium deserti]|uniref:DUF7159 domain-containing protein n=1 Tax=Mycobacterium deserti TaxID=2978347 RepID=A0ABT2MIF9_9MYCO|nr:hypothetical protein [Mycobacterium deserti]MCT7662069.1 hypothetical protein [Mycobacterium deserti]
MKVALGLSMTSTGVAWVLLDGQDPEGVPLDHDAFDVAIDGDIATYLAAVRGARMIATASGHQISTVGMTWTEDVAGPARVLRDALSDSGFESVVAVGLSHAARAWARAYGPALGFETCAVCVVESAAATVLTVGRYTVQTSVTHTRDGIGSWLTDTFARNQSQPERLFLVGSRGDLENVSASLGDAMPMPAVASDEAQLALARGAALALSTDAEPTEDLSIKEFVDAADVRRRPWFGAHARAATAVVAGMIALFAVVPALAGHDTPRSEQAQPAAAPAAAVSSSVSTVGVNAVRTPAPSTAIRPLIAEPAALPAPVVPSPAPAVEAPDTDAVAAPALSVAAEPVVPEPVTVEPAVAPAAPITAQPVAVPVAPIAAPPPPAPLLPGLPFVLPPWLAPPPPAVPAAAPAMPPPAAPPPIAAQPALVSPPAAAASPPPQAPVPPPPAAPLDPIGAALNPIFIGLP